MLRDTFLSDEQCWLHVIKSYSATFSFLNSTLTFGFLLVVATSYFIQWVYTKARHQFWTLLYVDLSLFWMLPEDSWKGSLVTSVTCRNHCKQGYPDPYGTFVHNRKRASSLEWLQPQAKVESSLDFSLTHFLSQTCLYKVPPSTRASIG